MEDKYKSQYTGEELDSTIKYLNDSWIQLSITGGTPGNIVSVKSGRYNVVSNLMNSYVTLSKRHATTGQVSIQYPETKIFKPDIIKVMK